jgi:hypothetical protein
MQTTQATGNPAGLVQTVTKTSHPYFHRRKKQHKQKVGDNPLNGFSTLSHIPYQLDHITPETTTTTEKENPEPDTYTLALDSNLYKLDEP